MPQASSAPPAPAAPQAPAIAGLPAPVPISTGQLTRADISALRARRDALTTQLNSAVQRRREVHEQLRSATSPADRAGLEQRLSFLDNRITRIEGEIDQNSSMMSSLEAMRLTVPPPSLPRTPRDRMAEAMIPIGVVFTLFVLCPLALSYARGIWKRGSIPNTTHSPEQNERLVRMEQAIDSIAIEIERVSEGQRFVTRLLAEGRAPASLAGGQQGSEPVQVRDEKFGINR